MHFQEHKTYHKSISVTTTNFLYNVGMYCFCRMSVNVIPAMTEKSVSVREVLPVLMLMVVTPMTLDSAVNII